MRLFSIIVILLALFAFLVWQDGAHRDAEQMAERAIAALETEVANLKSDKAAADASSPQPGEHSVLTDEQQRQKFAADYPAIAAQIDHPTIFQQIMERLDGLESRVTKLEDKPLSCPVPEVSKRDFEDLKAYILKAIDDLPNPAKPKARYVASSAPSKPQWRTSLDAVDTRYAVFVVRETKCNPCDSLEANAVSTKKFLAGLQDREATLARCNVDLDSDARDHFEITWAPTIVVFDKTQNKWHGIKADGKDSPGQLLWRVDQCIDALNTEDAPQPKTRRRLLN